MFKNQITVTIKEAKLKRRMSKKGDEEKGDLLSTLALETSLNVSQAKELGPGVAALLRAKKENEPQVLPFVKATLPDKPDGLRLTVFDGAGVKFEIDGCKVKKLRVARDPDAPSKAVLRMRIQVPPMAPTEMTYLNNAVGTELDVALMQPQTEMDV